MTAILKEHTNKSAYQTPVIQEIENHEAWHGHISGLEAQKLLQGKKIPYLFIIRKGEFEGDYYVSFLAPDLTIKHQPFAIFSTTEGWHYQNVAGGGPFATASFEDVLHLIMHCGKLEPTPKKHDSINK